MITFNDLRIKLQIVLFLTTQWDTAGQERFRTLTNSYYRGANGIIIAYDVTDKESFENVKNWMDEIQKYANEDVCILLMGNKSDMGVEKRVSYEEGQELAKAYKISFVETSAKTGYNINEAFLSMTKEIHDKFGSSGRTEKGGTTIVRLTTDTKSKCC